MSVQFRVQGRVAPWRGGRGYWKKKWNQCFDHPSSTNKTHCISNGPQKFLLIYFSRFVRPYWMLQTKINFHIETTWVYLDLVKCYPHYIWCRSITSRARSFVNLNDPYVFNWLDVNEISPLAITPNQAICLVYDIGKRVNTNQQFLICYKGIYKCKLVNSPPVHPLCFYSLWQNIILPPHPLRVLHGPLWETHV